MPKAKDVVEPAVAAEVPPVPTATAETKPSRVVSFWSASLRKLKLPSGEEVEFKSNKITLTDEKIIEELSAMCGNKHRIWIQ